MVSPLMLRAHVLAFRDAMSQLVAISTLELWIGYWRIARLGGRVELRPLACPVGL